VSSANHFLDPRNHDWVLMSQGVAEAGGGATPAAWRQAVLLAAEQTVQPGARRQRLTVWRQYWVGGHLAQGDIHAKLLQAWLALRGEPDDGAAIHLVSDLADPEQAHAQLSAFVRENFSMLAGSLMQTRESR
jgi:EpsI family protein